MWTYPIALALISVGVAVAERLFPARPQKQLRPRLWSDVAHLVFNGHFLGVMVFGVATLHVLPAINAVVPLDATVGRNLAREWPIAAQIAVALLVTDFLQWGVHRLLHAVPALWTFHKVHHSVVDGEMDWIVAFRFHWMEVVVYKSLLYVPLAWFGFGTEAVMTHAVFGTLIGHLNHANLDLGYGRLGYVLNNPRMHLWHHDAEASDRGAFNFGIIFSCWDWMFGTANVPPEPPEALGFDDIDQLPTDFVGHLMWPGQALVALPRAVWATLAAVLVATVWWLHAG